MNRSSDADLQAGRPTVALCLGIYGDPVGVGVSYERGTPVGRFRRARCGV